MNMRILLLLVQVVPQATKMRGQMLLRVREHFPLRSDWHWSTSELLSIEVQTCDLRLVSLPRHLGGQGARSRSTCGSGRLLYSRFKTSDHINILECHDNLSATKWRCRNHRRLETKFLHLLDSQVGIAVNVKKRSSSRKLNRVVRATCSYELAGFLHPLYGCTRSCDNPADFGSRL